jgi:protein gp37
MAEITGIGWTDHTYNPWIGCTKVSPGCDHCYAEAEWDKRRHRVEWGGERSRTKTADDIPLLDRKAREAGARRRIFCASQADVFDNQVPEEWHAALWALIAQCRSLDWMLLTKRPQNIPQMLPEGWPWSHVWLGTTTENQVEADRRLPILLRIPAVVHFASVEPQLEAVDLGKYVGVGLDWVIAGGESGPGYRPFDPDWARSLRDQCRASGTAFFIN